MTSEQPAIVDRQLRIETGHAETLAGYALIAPALVLIVVLFILPAGAVLAIAATDWHLGAKTLSFIGAANFASLLADPAFRAALFNTAAYVLMVVPSTLVLGLFLALLIESGKTLRAFYRAIHFLPFMTSLAAMAIVWEALLHPTIGLVNQLFAAVGLPTANWLRGESTVLPILAVIGTWQSLGLALVLFLAGLKAIPQDLYDAADIDGADGVLDRLRVVTLPSLAPVSLFVLIVVTLRAFATFDTVQILTRGGPDNASVMLLYALYRESFEYLRTGYGAAIAVIFLIIVITLAALQTRVVNSRPSHP
ncbi:carbohydrate ABC transporter permease [Bradyrhizobium iriomotense]|uniref:ABC transporter permease n=1 Tax=Bradyrhizobium iriomotense TaxID=441950 RepID=A0ABQ6B187_9BRAD|nr:sugar ABC transporter permease [Bradyrhizobium iriomotense]GLR87596.1 ABC transporter permease [Bradyrhizobium iriomotense]